jgi:CRP/FNR family cyclic AMP-dependent transcriptional regulator
LLICRAGKLSSRYSARAIFWRGLHGRPVHPARHGYAIAPTVILVIDKNEMLRALRAEHRLCEQFIGHVIARNIRIEEDLVAQLCDSCEVRLARALLMLAGYGKQGRPHPVLPNVSQGTLAKMIGSTRPRVNFFMNKFRERGYIKYNGKIKVNRSLLLVVLHE